MLLGLFFITVGMQLKLSVLTFAWSWVLLLLAALVIFKTILIMGLAVVLRFDLRTAFRTGLVLAQGGEFGFVLLLLAMEYKILPQDYGQVVLDALLLSMAIASILIRFNRSIAGLLFQETPEEKRKVSYKTEALQNHVIVCGYGRMGKYLIQVLKDEKVPYVALDMDPKRIREAKSNNVNAHYGDATHYQMLKASGIERAKILVVTLAELEQACKIVQEVRRFNADISILVRCSDDTGVKTLIDCGASEVIPETLEASLMVAQHLLLLLGVKATKISELVKQVRHDRYAMLRGIMPEQEEVKFDEQ